VALKDETAVGADQNLVYPDGAQEYVPKARRRVKGAHRPKRALRTMLNSGVADTVCAAPRSIQPCGCRPAVRGGSPMALANGCALPTVCLGAARWGIHEGLPQRRMHSAVGVIYKEG
jgi:hypothetical protein